MKRWLVCYKRRLAVLAALAVAVVAVTRPEYAEHVARAFLLLFEGIN